MTIRFKVFFEMYATCRNGTLAVVNIHVHYFRNKQAQYFLHAMSYMPKYRLRGIMHAVVALEGYVSQTNRASQRVQQAFNTSLN